MYQERIDNLRNSMKINGIDGVFLTGDFNRNYLSGFTGDESFAVITLEKAIFITDSRFTEQAKQQVKDYEIRQYQGSFVKFLDSLVKELKVTRLGFEDDIISFSTYKNYKDNLDCELVPLNGMVEKLRLIKDENEIDQIRGAAHIADTAFTHMLEFIKAGMTEREVGLELEFYMKKSGAKDLSFPSIVASGVRSCLPHGQATNKVLNNGDLLTLDFGCIYNDYCSDMTRTIAIGEPCDKLKEIYDVVFTAQKKALEVIKDGVSGFDADKAGRDYITEKGYGSYFGHGLGHGVGRYIHESPRLSPMSKDILAAGMIVTDEPGIYIPDLGGVRIEDLILVKKDGCEVLSESPKELIIIK